jgi:hypothetical protein
MERYDSSVDAKILMRNWKIYDKKINRVIPEIESMSRILGIEPSESIVQFIYSNVFSLMSFLYLQLNFASPYTTKSTQLTGENTPPSLRIKSLHTTRDAFTTSVDSIAKKTSIEVEERKRR